MAELFHCPACGAELSVAVSEPPDIEEPPPDIEPPADPENVIRLTNRSGRALVWPFQFARIFAPGEIADTPALLVDDAPVTSQADVLCRWPDGSCKHAVLAAVLDLPTDATVRLGFGNIIPDPPQELTPDEMLASAFDFEAILTIEGGGRAGSVSARELLDLGNYDLWTCGPVAQTIILGDDQSAEYDLGARPDDQKPLRPRFYATFWPRTKQVEVRVVVEASLTQRLADSAYVATVSLGMEHPELAYRLDLASGQKRHWAMTCWTRRFWLGEIPAEEVDIDWGLAHLARAGAVPSFDQAIDVLPQMSAKTVGDDPYDGVWNGHLIENSMGNASIRPDIGPYFADQVQALYPNADWRMHRQMRAIADQAASFPAHLRETEDKPLAIGDVTATGCGRTVSIAARPTLMTTVLDYGYTKPEDRVVFLDGKTPQPYWRVDGAHQPSFFYLPYLVSGDPWYLQEMYLWAGFSAAFYNGAATTQPYGRGPTGAEGVIDDQLRGAGWVFRNRAELAWIAPDRDPEKAFFTGLVHDAIARWEGSLDLAGTLYDNHPVKAWGGKLGNYYSANHGPASGAPLPLGHWESLGTPNGKDATIANNVSQGIYAVRADGAPVAGSFTAPWMQYHVAYALGRAGELGFATDALLGEVARWLVCLVLDTGYPKLVAMYQMPSEFNACAPGSTAMTAPPGGHFDSWAELLSAINEAWLTGEGWDQSSATLDLNHYFAANLHADGREMWAMAGYAMALDRGLPRAGEAWAWFEQNVYRAAPQEGFRTNARWAVVPRATKLSLPPILP